MEGQKNFFDRPKDEDDPQEKKEYIDNNLQTF